MWEGYTFLSRQPDFKENFMSLKNDGKKKLAEYFWMEIIKAILTSLEVKLSIKQLQALGLLDYVSEYNLVLEVEEPGQINFSHSQKSRKKTILKDKIDLEDSETFKKISMPWVDEKLLSGNEMLFEEYLSQEFDEEQWLKQSKIRL